MPFTIGNDPGKTLAALKPRALHRSAPDRQNTPDTRHQAMLAILTVRTKFDEVYGVIEAAIQFVWRAMRLARRWEWEAHTGRRIFYTGRLGIRIGIPRWGPNISISTSPCGVAARDVPPPEIAEIALLLPPFARPLASRGASMLGMLGAKDLTALSVSGYRSGKSARTVLRTIHSQSGL